MKIKLSDNNYAFFIERNIFTEAQLVFDVDGSVIALGDILESKNLLNEVSSSIGSEPWLSDDSDFYRFNGCKLLKSLIVKIPSTNAHFRNTLSTVKNKYYNLKLSSENCTFTIPPKKYRSFDAKNKKLICFDKVENKTLSQYFITKKFSLLIDDNKKYVGFILDDPLDVITNDYGGEVDDIPSNFLTYGIFEEFFTIFSDNTCYDYDDDMEKLVRTLLRDINQFKINSIIGKHRRAIISQGIKSLESYFI